jgi:TRAP-type C4-dicarboxylate transport system permease small subunit
MAALRVPGDGFEESVNEGVLDTDEVAGKFEYVPGIFLVPRVKEIAKYEKAAIKVAVWSDWLSVGAIFFLLGMTFLDVLLRALFKAPFSGTYDWTRYIMVFAVAFGMPICTMNEEHVGIDLLFRKFPNMGQNVLHWFNYAVTCFFLYILITENWYQGNFNQMTGQTSSGVPWPTYPFYYFIATGFICMLFIVIVKMINLGRGIK